MATEEQLNTGVHMVSLRAGGAWRAGQRLTISNRTVAKLSFPLKKNNSPTGNVTFTIRQLDDVVLATKVLGDASALSATLNWEEVTFDAPVFINEEVRILAEYNSGDGTNNVACYATLSDVKADEYWTNYGSGTWQPQTGSDAPYIYTYEPGLAAPSVSSDPATEMSAVSAKPNGTLDDDGGEACDCGFEWGETIAYGNTTPTQSRTSGQTFAQTIIGLDPNKTYHFRAFATNSAGTSYGADTTFTTNRQGMSGFPPALSEILGY